MGEQPASTRGTGKVRARQEPVAALAAHSPWMPIEPAPEIVSAIHALARGDCPPHLQKSFLQWVITTSDNGGAHYFPGDAGRRDTDFALGRAFLGRYILTFLKLKLQRSSENG